MIRILKYELTEREKFSVRGYLTDQCIDNLILAYSVSRDKDVTFSSKQSGYNVSNRWLNSEAVQEYISSLGYSKIKAGNKYVYVHVVDDEDILADNDDMKSAVPEDDGANKLQDEISD